MKSGLSEIVHIIPLGQEFDKAVRPFDTAAANHVYVVTDKLRDDHICDLQIYPKAGCPPSEYFVSRVVKYLKKKHISTDVVRTNFSDMGEFLKTISSLIRSEQNRGNKVYVNMSAAGEFGAAVATLAGMALNAEVYCVHADNYASDRERLDTGVSVCSTNVVSMLPKVEIHLPDEIELLVLAKLYYSENNILSASEISDVVERGRNIVKGCGVKICESSLPVSSSICVEKITPYVNFEPESDDVERWKKRKVQSRNLMKVSGMMKRMEEKGYVTKAKFGRKMMYLLTERGMYVLILSGTLDREVD